LVLGLAFFYVAYLFEITSLEVNDLLY